MKRILLLFGFIFVCNVSGKAQCPVVSCPTLLVLPCSTTGAGQFITATSNYATNINSRWLGPGGIPIVSSGTSTSVVGINCPGTYTVEFKDNSSNCVTTQTVLATSLQGPTFGLSSTSNFTLGSGSFSVCDINIVGANTQPSGGVVSYTFFSAAKTPTSYLTSPLVPAYTVNVCGDYVVIVKDNGNQCISSYTFHISKPGSPECDQKYTTTTGIGLTTQQNNFNLFPNPVSQLLNMSCESPGKINYVMLDLSGREILKGSFANTKILDISAVESGTYLFKFESGIEIFYKKAIIKN